MKKVISVLMLFLIISCKPIAAKLLLGVDTTPEWVANDKIINQFSEYKIPEENSFILDTAVFAKNSVKKVYENIEILKSNAVKIDSALYKKIQKSTNDNLQPVQIRYFDSSGRPIFKLVNCYLENIFNIDWNFEKSFDTYPPTTKNEVLNYGNEDLNFFLPMFRKLNG